MICPRDERTPTPRGKRARRQRRWGDQLSSGLALLPALLLFPGVVGGARSFEPWCLESRFCNPQVIKHNL